MPRVAVILSAGYEWRVWLELHPHSLIYKTPFGGAFNHTIRNAEVISLQGGWGKISAAASAQWVIDANNPDLIVNLGTCGGLEGRIERHTIILVDKTYQYDIQEQMTDPETANQFYACELNLNWLSSVDLPEGVTRSAMYSADRDILPSDVLWLINKHGARAADWESGAIAWVANRNHVQLIILRGVSDIVCPEGGESYGQIAVFHRNTRKIINTLAGQLPWWIQTYFNSNKFTSRV